LLDVYALARAKHFGIGFDDEARLVEELQDIVDASEGKI
jgi:hypothetical protein